MTTRTTATTTITDYSRPPPSPTKEQYNKYGILYSYSCIEEALESALPGDRIYLMPGEYHDLQPLKLQMNLEIIGFTKDAASNSNTKSNINIGAKTANEVILFPCDDEPIFCISHGCVRISNVTFRTFGLGVSQRNNVHETSPEEEEVEDEEEYCIIS